MKRYGSKRQHIWGPSGLSPYHCRCCYLMPVIGFKSKTSERQKAKKEIRKEMSEDI